MNFFSTINYHHFSNSNDFARDIKLSRNHLFQRTLMHPLWGHFDLQTIATLFRNPEAAKLQGTIA